LVELSVTNACDVDARTSTSKPGETARKHLAALIHHAARES
jgi:hypothetical protein